MYKLNVKWQQLIKQSLEPTRQEGRVKQQWKAGLTLWTWWEVSMQAAKRDGREEQLFITVRPHMSRQQSKNANVEVI